MHKHATAVLTLVLATFFVSCARSQQGPMTSTPNVTAPTYTTLAMTGPGSGNGGKGVLLDGRPYLYDLVESGVEKTPFFNSKIPMDSQLRERVAKIFSSDPTYPVDLIAQKLSEVMSLNYAVGILMLKTMDLFRWRIVDLSPMPVNDERQGIQVEKSQFVQLAERLEKSIIINRHEWMKMDVGNRTALIFHEIIYAFTQPRKAQSGYFTQDTGAVQELTAYLFSPDMSSTNFLGNMTSSILPDTMKFGGKHIVDDSVGGMLRMPKNVIFYISKGYEDTNRKKIANLPVAFMNADLNVESQTADNICSQIGDGKWLISFSVINEYRSMAVDFYEGQQDHFYSYVKVSAFSDKEGDSAPETSGLFKKADCPIIFKKVFDDAFAKAMQNSKEIEH